MNNDITYISSGKNKWKQRYKKYNKKPWMLHEELYGIKYNIFQKLIIWIHMKHVDVVEYYKSSPNKLIERYITKPYKRNRILKFKQ